MLPVADTIKVFGFTQDSTDKRIAEIKHSHPDIAALLIETNVNGVGNAKLCAALPTMMQILWLLPTNPRTSAFRMKCANDIVRQMKGDASLLIELEHNHQTLQQTGGLHFHEAPTEAVLHNPEPSESPDPRLFEMTIKKREMELNVWIKKEELELARMTKTQEMELKGQEIELKGQEIELKGQEMELKGQEIKLKERVEESIQRLNTNHFNQTKERMDFLASLGLGCDRNKIACMDRLNNYEARRYICDEPVLAIEAADAVSNKPMQVAEIMEFKLKMPSDEVRQYANGAGGAVAKAFREHFGKDFKFYEATRQIQGCTRTIKSYGPEHVALATQVIHDYVEAKRSEPAHKKTKN